MAIGCIALVVFAVGLFTIEIFGASQEACHEFCWGKYGGYGVIFGPVAINMPYIACMDGCAFGSQL